MVDEINAGRPQCPVGLNTLVIPRKVTLGEHVNQPYVYLNCGHVQGECFLTSFFSLVEISFWKCLEMALKSLKNFAVKLCVTQPMNKINLNFNLLFARFQFGY